MTEQKNDGLVFFTINNSGDGLNNPRSVLVVEALKECGHVAFVAKSPTEGKSMARGILVVPLFDGRANRFSPMPSTSKNAPDWVRALPSGSCVAIGKRCADFPSHVAKAAEHIAKMFSREARKSGNGGSNYPWGPAPSPDNSKKRKRRSRRLAYLHQQYHHSQQR